jgi:hypothetical protein
VLLFLALALAALQLLPAFIRVSARAERANNTNRATGDTQNLARLSESVSVHAARRGNPTINLSDGRTVLTSYAGPDELQQALSQNQAEPLSLAAADFDEDGVPDLLSGYGFQGHGIVSLLRGNVDAIYPHAPEAQQRRRAGNFTDAPFLSPALLSSVPTAADFIGTGDFDGDSHWDMVTGSRGGSSLYLLAGDGHGGFSQPRTVALSGALTAFVTGEINRPDGLTDLVVGVSTKAGPRVLVFEGPNGALQSKPEELEMPAAVSALALGQVDSSYEIDLGVAAGPQLLVVSGRDRKLSHDEERQQGVKPAHVAVHNVGALTDLFTSVTLVGSRSWKSLATEAVEVRSRVRRLAEARGSARSAAQFERIILSQIWPQAMTILPAKISSSGSDDIVLVNSDQEGIDRVACRGLAGTSSAPTVLHGTRARRSPNHALEWRCPSRCCGAASAISPDVHTTVPAQTFVVNSTADTNDGACNINHQWLHLREAINAANNNLVWIRLTSTFRAGVYNYPSSFCRID